MGCARGHLAMVVVATHTIVHKVLLLLQFFMYNIRTRMKLRKGEGEPRDEAKLLSAPTYNFAR